MGDASGQGRWESKSGTLVIALFAIMIVVELAYGLSGMLRVAATSFTTAILLLVAHQLSLRRMNPPILDTLSLLLVAMAFTAPVAVWLGILETIVEAWTPFIEPLQGLRHWLTKTF